MGDRPTILVAGAGIAGLTAALAISRFGFDIVICERAPKLSEIGAGIQLSPNAGRVLADLGLESAIDAAAIAPKAIDVMSGATGKTLTSLKLAPLNARYGCPYRVIHRADLQTILARAVERESGIRLMLGTTVADVLHRDREMFVKLQGPRGDLIQSVGLLGADGIWSATRDRVNGAAQPHPTGRTAWRAMIPRDNIPGMVPIDRIGLWLGAHAHLVHYPIARGAAINVVAIVEETWNKPGWNARGRHRQIAERFEDWPTEARAIIGAPQSWQKWALNTVDPAGTWSEGATTLIGDAAHAMVPFLAQGAAMAIEDAAVLASSLAAIPDDVATAFSIYEAERRPRVARVWKAAMRNGERYHLGSHMAGFRDFALRIAGPKIIERQNDWVYDWRPPPLDDAHFRTDGESS